MPHWGSSISEFDGVVTYRANDGSCRVAVVERLFPNCNIEESLTAGSSWGVGGVRMPPVLVEDGGMVVKDGYNSLSKKLE
jgi:hypothetical protein